MKHSYYTFSQDTSLYIHYIIKKAIWKFQMERF